MARLYIGPIHPPLEPGPRRKPAHFIGAHGAGAGGRHLPRRPDRRCDACEMKLKCARPSWWSATGQCVKSGRGLELPPVPALAPDVSPPFG